MTKEELRKRPKDFSKVCADGICLDGIKILLAYNNLKSEVDVSGVVAQAESLGIKVVFPGNDPYCFEDVRISGINVPALMLVPGLVFTADGKRLGRGRGFYDRTLSVIPSCVKTIGVCKKSQLVQDIPMEAHDKKVMQVLCF